MDGIRMKDKAIAAGAIVLTFIVAALLTAFVLGPLLGLTPTFGTALKEVSRLYVVLMASAVVLHFWGIRKRARRERRP
ncbi:hypothetical protein GCM10023081_00230 [Arthrobacter ginkgonis]|uniref:DUF4405 domain-containing protein n=1 Tax=Arthrobacter ginkgonis TaxID=1630594 RepID=A0ABP7BPE5_9MICC